MHMCRPVSEPLKVNQGPLRGTNRVECSSCDPTDMTSAIENERSR
jgi:hypothetical protein